MKFKKFDSFVNENIQKGQLKFAEDMADKLFAKYGIDVAFTKHFIERVNDERNTPEITLDELIQIFQKTAEKFGKEFSSEYKTLQVVVKDIATQINIPFVLKPDPDPREETTLVSKTIMRTSEFRTSSSNKILKV